MGDLGNIESYDVATPAVINTYDHLVSLSGANNIIGRSVVIHADPDDLGLGGQSDSLTTGHAGARVACGVIGQCAPFDVPNVLTTKWNKMTP